MAASIHHILQKEFGYKEFRPYQQQVIEDVLAGRDSLVIMPTGGGKSITYQVPALAQKGVGVVISPLIALMKDQVDALRANGVNAGAIHSAMSDSERQWLRQQMQQQQLDLLYMSPERVVSPRMLHYLSQQDIAMFAVDEAHCISSWGHDFRPEYQQLKILKEQFPQVPVMALTATADKVTRRDIVQQLGLHEPRQVVASFDRPNIRLEARPGQKKQQQIEAFVASRPNAPGIVYCLSRKSTESVAEKLRNKGYKAKAYHAGLDNEERHQVQNDFLRDDIQIVCATIAFGMGIDKSNIRWIIHYNMPKNVESYYQEIGRAGRDGLAADALLFYSYNDVHTYFDFVDQAEHANGDVEKAKIKRMHEYAQGLSCRRQALLSYFGEPFGDSCNNCDNCEHPHDTFDGTEVAQKALSAVYRLKESVGIQLLVDVLRGSQKAEVVHQNLHLIKTYGAGRDISYEAWQFFLAQLINQGLLEVAYDQKHVLKLTAMAQDVLFGKKQVSLVAYQTLQARQEQTARPPTKKALYEQELFDELRQLRKQLASERGLPPFVIFSDKSLKEMVEQQPVTLEHFAQIQGVGTQKLSDYGQVFIKTIGQYMRRKQSAGKQIKGSTQKVTYQLFREGLKPEEIAKQRELSPVTVYGHLAQLVEQGYEVDVHQVVLADEYQRVAKAYQLLGDEQGIRPLFDYLEQTIDYGKIKLVVSHLKYNQN